MEALAAQALDHQVSLHGVLPGLIEQDDQLGIRSHDCLLPDLVHRQLSIEQVG